MKYIKYMLTLVCLLVISVAYADQKGGSVMFYFSGRLVSATPCKVNNDQLIVVPFDNVPANNEKIDSGLYVHEIPFMLDCSGTTSTSTVKLILKASSAEFDTTTTMRTNIAALGVQVLDGGNPIQLNAVIEIPISKPLSLQAKLVRDRNIDLSKLPTQEFTATGTLMAEYI